MPKVQTITSNFTSGEFTPRLRGRPDLEKYNSSAEKLENCVVLRHGGVTIRPSFDYRGEAKVSSQTSRIIPFVYSRTDAFLLELGDLYVRFWKNGALVEVSPGVPYEVATPWTQDMLAVLDFTQGADTLILTHPDRIPRRLRRFADTNWVLDQVPFAPAAVYESGHRSNTVNLTLSNVTVGAGRTVTASAAFFLNSDVGRTLAWDVTGSATITAFASSTSVTVTVTSAFTNAAIAGPNWLLEGSPRPNQITPNKPGPLGARVEITASTENTWRSEDVGKFLDISGGIIQITSRDGTNPDTVAVGRIRSLLGSEDPVPPGSWALLGPAWSQFDGYPATATLHQQRLWFAGTRKFPQSMWGSRPGLFFDFSPGSNDDSAVYKTLDSDDINLIQYLTSSRDLVALTYGSEFDARGGVEKPITQTNAQITKRSRWGCELVRPEEAGTDLLFVQRGGLALRALFRTDLDTFDTRDVSIFSEHLLRDGVRSLSWEQTPEQVCWIATGAGKLLALTYTAEQNVIAFCSGAATGFVEWLATIPDGAVDATYALVRRTVDGATKRYIERLNWSAPPGQDSRKEVTGAASTTWPGFDHLEGETLAVLADDVYVGPIEVVGGVITTPRPALKVSAGLPYTARVRMQSPEIPTGTGTSQGQQQSTNKVIVRFLETTGCKINGEVIAFRQFGENVLDAPPPVFTGFKDVTTTGWAKGESPLELTQDQPYPWTILGVIRSFTVNVG